MVKLLKIKVKISLKEAIEDTYYLPMSQNKIDNILLKIRNRIESE